MEQRILKKGWCADIQVKRHTLPLRRHNATHGIQLLPLTVPLTNRKKKDTCAKVPDVFPEGQVFWRSRSTTDLLHPTCGSATLLCIRWQDSSIKTTWSPLADLLATCTSHSTGKVKGNMATHSRRDASFFWSHALRALTAMTVRVVVIQWYNACCSTNDKMRCDLAKMCKPTKQAPTRKKETPKENTPQTSQKKIPR